MLTDPLRAHAQALRQGLLTIHQRESAGAPGGLSLLAGVAVQWVANTGSTNTDLLAEQFAAAPAPVRVRISEVQTAGRGRRGRSWAMAAHASFAVSVAIEAQAQGEVLRRWPLLPIAVGVSLAERLNCLPERAGAVRLKWPNDLWIGERKIGGILIETRRDRGGIARAVIGVGLNLLDGAHLQAFETPATALFGETFTGSRAALGAEIVAAILAAYAQLQAGDDRSLFARWLVLDALQGRTVRIEQQDGHAWQGLADGIEPDGSLRVLVGDQVRKVVSAEGSVRIVAQDETALESPSVGPAQPLEQGGG